MIRRRIVSSRFARRNLDPAAPLFALRRISAGQDEAGRAIVILPGQPFKSEGVDLRRLGFMYRNRWIGHDLPAALRNLSAKHEADLTPSPDSGAPPAAPAETAPPARQTPRRGQR